jgi:adenylate kinase
MLNIVLFGPPGAGKGTQSELIIEKYDLVHFSTGDILRAEIKAETELGKKAKQFMDKGELVTDEIVIGMIENKISQNIDSKGFIFDGFPRTTAQAEALDAILSKNNISISAMLALDVPKDELIKRLLIRGKDSGRVDDQNQEVIENRIKVYNNETAPVMNFYNKKGKYRAIEGIGTIEEIFEKISIEINKL